jgi:hypothetical protein
LLFSAFHEEASLVLLQEKRKVHARMTVIILFVFMIYFFVKINGQFSVTHDLKQHRSKCLSCPTLRIR